MMQVLTVRQIAGRTEVVLRWDPDPELLRAAEGTVLHMSSHILDAGGDRMIVFDGPRARPGIGPHGDACVLPLEIPSEPGRYQIHIGPVVEARFWASERGYTPLILEAERATDGSLLVCCPSTNSRYALETGLSAFPIDTPLYGYGDSERCVEIPWVLSRFRGETCVLDVGHVHAESRYLQARDRLGIPFLVGLDIAVGAQPGICSVAGDVLAAPFRPGVFDLILAVSVIAYNGLDAAACLADLLRPGGRLLITVPFGRHEDHGRFVQYDQQRIRALVEATRCDLTVAEFYAYGSFGWSGPVDPAGLGGTEYRTEIDSAGAVACLELARRYPFEKREPAVRVPLEMNGFADSLSSQTIATLKSSGVWSKMRGETARMRPVMLLCETVNICNSDCIFCPYSMQTRPLGFMAMDLFERVLNGYCELGGGHLSLTPMVGDALLDRFWMGRIRLLAGLRDSIVASMTSNLYALEHYSDEEVIEMLGVLRRIHISCYGLTPEESEAITRRRLFDKFLVQASRLLRLHQDCGGGGEVRVGFRLLKHRTADELAAFLKQQLGTLVPSGAATTYANWGNAIHGDLPGEARWIPDRINESPCIMLPLAMQVYWDGRVSACPCCDYDSSRQLSIGDVTKQSLSAIFNSPENQGIWRAHDTGCLPAICRNCTFHVPLQDLTSRHAIIRSPLDFIGG
jgi:SAM-dependent methyltransferase